MALGNTSFAGAIRETASTLGREPTPEEISRIELVLQSLGSVTDDDQVVADLGAGPVPISAAITAELNRLPAKPSKAQSEAGYVKIQLGNSTGYRKADDFAVTLSTAFKASKAAATAREVATWTNPWKGQVNRTRQQVIINTNPALAAKLKAEASA